MVSFLIDQHDRILLIDGANSVLIHKCPLTMESLQIKISGLESFISKDSVVKMCIINIQSGGTPTFVTIKLVSWNIIILTIL